MTGRYSDARRWSGGKCHPSQRCGHGGRLLGTAVGGRWPPSPPIGSIRPGGASSLPPGHRDPPRPALSPVQEPPPAHHHVLRRHPRRRRPGGPGGPAGCPRSAPRFCRCPTPGATGPGARVAATAPVCGSSRGRRTPRLDYKEDRLAGDNAEVNRPMCRPPQPRGQSRRPERSGGSSRPRAAASPGTVALVNGSRQRGGETRQARVGASGRGVGPPVPLGQGDRGQPGVRGGRPPSASLLPRVVTQSVARSSNPRCRILSGRADRCRWRSVVETVP